MVAVYLIVTDISSLISFVSSSSAMEYSTKLGVLLVALMLAMAVTAQNSEQDFVDAHNAARADVGLGGVARRRGTTRRWCGATRRPDWTAADAVALWVSNKQYYDHDSNTCSAPEGESCGHYTQVVWRDSTAIGCARVVCDSGDGVFIICSYNPPGNFPGVSPY